MNCWYMGIMVVVLGIAVCLLALVYLITKKTFAQIAAWLFSVASIAVIRLAANGAVNISGQGWRVALCGMDSMSCRAVMLPHVSWIAAGLCVMSSLWAICSLVIGKR